MSVKEHSGTTASVKIAVKSWSSNHPLAMAVIGTFLAIASTAILDAIGFGLNILPLIPLFFLFWYLQHLSRREIGLTWGRRRAYELAVFYPILAVALLGLIASLSGAVTVHSIDWSRTLINLFVAQLIPTIVFALITEEGIFRGWLWASLRRAGVAELWVMALTSAAFAAWHISSALLLPGVRVPLAQVPVYILNAGVIGFAWALMRRRSGSIVVTSVSHGVWNSLAYVMFGEGTAIGVLGIHNTSVFGPEVGVVGLAVNAAFAAVLWAGFSRARATGPSTAAAKATR